MYVTVKDLATFTGMSESGIRNVIQRHKISAHGGTHYGAHLYNLRDILAHISPRDRLAPTS